MSVVVRAVLLIESDMTTLPDDLTCTRPFRVYDTHAQVTLQGGAGGDQTLVRRQAGGTGAFTSLVTLTEGVNVAGTIVRAAAVAVAQDDFIIGDVLRVQQEAGSTVLANHYIAIIPRVIPGA